MTASYGYIELENGYWVNPLADRKTESNSEKPNNCEHITEDGVTCAKYPACDDCLDNPLKIVCDSISCEHMLNDVRIYNPAPAPKVKVMFQFPKIKNVRFNDPATIVFWADGSKTVVKCQDNDVFDPEKGLAMAISKKALGNKSNFNNEFKKWLPEERSE